MSAVLDEKITKQLSEMFQKLNHPVQILFFSKEEGCDYCEDTRQLLEEVSQLSEKIHLEVLDIHRDSERAKAAGVDKTPGILIAGRDGEMVMDYGIRFAGIPAGSEFTSLIRDILMVSSRESGLSAETKRYLSELKDPIHLEVFVTPT